MVGRQRRRGRGRLSTAEDDISLSWVGDCLVARAVSRRTLISADSAPSQSQSQSQSQSHHHHHHHHRHLHAPRRPELKRTTTRVSHKKKKERCSSLLLAQAAADQHQLNCDELSQLHERAAILSMAAAKASSLPHLLDLEEGEISPTASQEFHLEELRRLALLAMRLRGRQPLQPSPTAVPNDLEEGEISPDPSNSPTPLPSTIVDMMPQDAPHHIPAEALDLHLSTLLRRLASLSMTDCATQDSIFDAHFLHSLQALTI